MRKVLNKYQICLKCRIILLFQKKEIVDIISLLT